MVPQPCLVPANYAQRHHGRRFCRWRRRRHGGRPDRPLPVPGLPSATSSSMPDRRRPADLSRPTRRRPSPRGSAGRSTAPAIAPVGAPPGIQDRLERVCVRLSGRDARGGPPRSCGSAPGVAWELFGPVAAEDASWAKLIDWCPLRRLARDRPVQRRLPTPGPLNAGARSQLGRASTPPIRVEFGKPGLWVISRMSLLGSASSPSR